MQGSARRERPAAFDFEGGGDEALEWLDTVYGTSLRLTGPIGTVQHRRVGSDAVAFDHLKIDARFAFDSDPMPALVVVDMLDGTLEYTRDEQTDRSRDGDTVLASGWNMPFTGHSDSYEVRATTFSAEAVSAAVADIAPDYPWERISFTSYVPHSPAAGARWRAALDELSRSFPDAGDTAAHGAATRLLGHLLLHTFPNNVVHGADARDLARAERDATPATLRLATRIIEERAQDELSLADLAEECRVSPRSLQYAFRDHLGCSPMAYLRRVRLDLARQDLRGGGTVSVGEVAARYGFFNPGRFAAEYRRVFEENPRQTLLRASS